MRLDRFVAIRKESLRLAVEVGLPPAIRYLRRNGIKPTKHMVKELMFSAAVMKRSQ